MEALQKRLEALEQQTQELKHHTKAIERRLRWWRRMAYGLGVLGLLSLPLTSGTAQEGYSSTKELRSLSRRVEDLEYKLVHIASGPDDVTISGANLRIVNGLGATDTTNGLGNLIVGYNELRGDGFTDTRTGSHNVVVGSQQNFSSFGGLVVGDFNEISGSWASVSGGSETPPAGSVPQSAGGSSTQPAAATRQSAAVKETPPAGSMPQSAEGSSTQPAALERPSAGGPSTHPAALDRPSAEGTTT